MIFHNINKSSKMLTMSVEKPIFLADMCRVCMITSDFLKEAISYELTPKIVNMLNSFADLDISMDECLHSLICNNCYTRLRESLNFKNICIESNNTLKSLIHEMKTASEKAASTSSTATSSNVEIILCDNTVKIEEEQTIVTTNSSSTIQTETNVPAPKTRSKDTEKRSETRKSPIVRRKRCRKANITPDVTVGKRVRTTTASTNENCKPKNVRKTKTVSVRKRREKCVNPVSVVIPTSSPEIIDTTGSDKTIEICEIINLETPTVINLNDGQEDIKIDFVDIKEPAIMFEPCPDLLSALGLIKRKRSESTEIGVEVFSSIEEYNKSIDNSILSNDSGRSTSSSNNNKPNTPTNNNKIKVEKKDSKWKRDFICHICNQELFDYGTLRRHLVTHGELPFPCKICDKRFKGARKLRAHTLDEHSGGRPYGCIQCDSKFRSLDEYTAHLRRHSGSGEPHVCPNCPRRFASARKLKEHSTSHEIERKSELKKNLEKIGDFTCSLCDRRFRKKCDLERHERVHSGEKPYECLICKGTFQQAHNLTKHMVTHTGMKSYTCDICNKTFGRSDVLARHMHVHEVHKPFTCEGCRRTFARHSQLITHMEKRHCNSQDDNLENHVSE